MDRYVNKIGFICAFSQSKYPYKSCLAFNESVDIVHCCE